MSQTVTIRRRVRFRTAGPRQALCQQNARPEETPGRIPRVARLMALATRLETLIATGRVPNYVALARLAHVSRARITQITNLTLLAPDIQEAVLFLTSSTPGPPSARSTPSSAAALSLRKAPSPPRPRRSSSVGPSWPWSSRRRPVWRGPVSTGPVSARSPSSWWSSQQGSAEFL